MEAPIDVFFGSPLTIESEKLFLKCLLSDLKKTGKQVIVFCNFYPPKNPTSQIDFLVITLDSVCHIELKHLTAPVFGEINGLWKIRLANGYMKPIDRARNPYHQTKQGKYAISDEMKIYASKDPLLQNGSNGMRFYKMFESVICIFPNLLPESRVHTDKFVRTLGYPQLLEFLGKNKNNPGWSMEQWTRFAMQLSLIRQASDIETSDPELSIATETVQEYSKLLQEFISQGLPELIPTTIKINGSQNKSNELFNFGLSEKHGQIIGISGSGKSHLIKHITLSILQSNRIPIFCSAKHYDGQFQSLLDHSVASFHPNTFQNLMKSIKIINKGLYVIIDGWNECPEKYQADLIQNLQASFLKWHCPMLITSQSKIEMPESLKGEVIELDLPEMEERKHIIQLYSGKEASVEWKRLFEPFRTPYELSLASQILNHTREKCPSRFSILDSYVESCCNKTSNSLMARRSLVRIASQMAENLENSLLLPNAWQILESYLSDQKIPLSFVKDLLNTRLIQVQYGRFSFTHEKLQRFLEAEALCLRYTKIPELASALSLPKNSELIEFVILSQKDIKSVTKLLEVVPKKSILLECFRGHLGELALIQVQKDARRLIKNVKDSLINMDITLLSEEKASTEFIIYGLPRWSEYGFAMMDIIGSLLHSGSFLEESLDLIRATDLRLAEILEKKYPRLYPSLKSIIFMEIYVTLHNKDTVIPTSLIVRACHNNFPSRIPSTIIERLVKDYNRMTPGELYILSMFVTRGQNDFEEYSLTLFKICWGTAIYHLQLQALEMLQSFASRISNQFQETIKEILSSLTTKNPFLSTQLVETMNSYGMIDPVKSIDEVRKEIKQILTTPNDLEVLEDAYHVRANMFEDIFQNVYYEAVQELTQKERVRLFTLAAMGAPDYTMDLSWILEDLLKSDDPSSIPAFRFWAQRVPRSNTVSHQDEGARFWLAHIGLAKWAEAPIIFNGHKTNDERAWQIYGEIIYWLNRAGLTDKEKRDKTAHLWQLLQKELGYYAVDPLMHLMDSTVVIHGTSPIHLFEFFKIEICLLLMSGLKNLDKLTTIFGRVENWIKEDHAAFIIRMLGTFGTSDNIQALMKYIDDSKLGPIAIASIRKLNVVSYSALNEQ